MGRIPSPGLPASLNSAGPSLPSPGRPTSAIPDWAKSVSPGGPDSRLPVVSVGPSRTSGSRACRVGFAPDRALPRLGLRRRLRFLHTRKRRPGQSGASYDHRLTESSVDRCLIESSDRSRDRYLAGSFPAYVNDLCQCQPPPSRDKIEGQADEATYRHPCLVW